MGYGWGLGCRFAAAIGFAAVAALATVPAVAQAVQKPDAKAAAGAGKKDVNTALKAYDAGARAFEQGKMEKAIEGISSALATGGLQTPQMAKALYYRGAAYRKLGKPAQAISDLTTAIWLKNGLSDADRAQAIDQRQAAYREAGLGDSAPPVAQQKAEPAPPSAAPAAAPASTPASASAPAQLPASTPGAAPPAVTPPAASQTAQPAQTAAAPSSFFSFPWQSTGGGGGEPQSSIAPIPEPPSAPASPPAQSAAAAQPTLTAPFPVPAAVAPAPAAPDPPPAALSSWVATSEQAAVTAPSSPSFAPVAVAEAAPARAAEPPPPASLSAAPIASPAPAPDAAPAEPSTVATDTSSLAKAGSAVTGFFGNLFGGGGSGGSEATTAPSSTLSTSATAADGTHSSATPSSWSAGTTVAAVSPSVGAASPVSVGAPGGQYKLQVAAVRSRDEANAIVARLASDHAFRLGARQPEIDSTVIGNMGTFYRVRVGPYANAAEPGQLCTALRPHGFDCLVVAQ